jgi:diguanylate cyclase (GGDEF)-like protein/PAS domain S-box-containing protein
MTWPMGSRPSRGFFVLGSLAVAGYFAVPVHGAALGLWYNAIGLACAAGIAVGAVVNRPASRAPWLLFAASEVLWAIGNATTGAASTVLHLAHGSWGNAFTFAGYPCVLAGVVLIYRSQSPSRPLFLDTAIVTTGVGAVAWVQLIEPLARDSDLSVLGRVAAISNPVGDLVLLALASRLLLAAHWVRVTPLLAGALFVPLVGDAVYAIEMVHGTYTPGSWIDVTWLASAVLLATAALDPSMREIGARPVADRERLSRSRLVLLSAAALLAPTMTALGARGPGLVVTSVASALLFLLVIARMAGVVAGHRASELREQLLRHAAAGLVTARDRAAIYEVAIETAHALTEEAGGRRTSFGIGDLERVVIVSSRGEDAESFVGTEYDVSLLVDAGLHAATSADLEVYRGTDRPELVVFPLLVHGEPRGLITIRSQHRLSPAVRTAVQTLGAQVALALETAALYDDLLEQQSEARFRSLVQNSSDVIAILEPDLTIRYHTPSAETLLGYEAGELDGRRLSDLVHHEARAELVELAARVQASPDTPARFECRLLHADGSHRMFEAILDNLLDDTSVRGIVFTAHDVTERNALELQLTHQAFHDGLTNLANRALFVDRLNHALERTQRNETTAAVLFVDLDDFKTVNDSLGHAAGDELLELVARRLREAVRPTDTPARFGGDEFAVLVEDLTSKPDAIEIANRLLDRIAGQIELQGTNIVASASIGIAFAEPGQTPGDLLRNADAAMYTAKSGGKGRWEIFDPGMRKAALKRLELHAELKRAVEEGEFAVHYQPVVRLATGEITGFEALARWQHPQRGLVEPGAFIPTLEETELIVALGSQVLERACRAAARWQAEDVSVSVNLSARQLRSPDIVREVDDVLRATGLEPGRLVLEITESMLMEDATRTIRRLESLKEIGVVLAIDDFGTGYSSLEYLRKFPVDVLKIAKPFVDGVGIDPAASRLAKAILGIGETLGLTTVGEGIELPEQRDGLRRLGCVYGQGWLFARAMPEADAAAALGPALRQAA